ncbi:DUF1289 domain-containing protein [Hydrogenophaga sp.]|uniref:DUF1289 domain-containing protein n=1 Tax=Hydrogenophaga sp. TaxID=1904254 RepID=UPI0025BC62E7|nr:DUF1289 domain-containing protein [Hydrogenophaga sp.]
MNQALINLHDARAQHVGPGVPSPCVSVCELDEALGRCKGCWRTLQEIGQWTQLSDAERLEVWAQIEARQLGSV